MKTLYKYLVLAISLVSMFGCQNNQQENIAPGISVAPSYSYYMTGRTDLLKGFVIRVDNPEKIQSPGLVFLASGIERANEAYVIINGIRYGIPALSGTLEDKIEVTLKSQGKAQFYSVTGGDDIVGKFVIPLKKGDVIGGINEVAFYREEDGDGFEILTAQIQSVNEQKPTVVDQTYHLLARGRPPMMKDFDYVSNYKREKVRHEKDIPEWARRGKVNFYRAGIDYENLDRMFEMFEEARINLVAVHVPRDTKSADYQQLISFIDRCHKKGIYITAFNSLGGIGLRELMMNPEFEGWISHDEYGAKRWRQPGKVFAADLANKNYREYELIHAALQIDIGVDELYYDYAIGGTGDVLDFLADVREIAKVKGKQVTIYGNCKGNILVDEVCDLTKSEGTGEAGVWSGKWVHNIPQARFYYAVGNGVKPYRSKYEGADPGVPNPGAYDVREGMKYGWKKPIAEASAFQSHFCIAEAGDKLLNHWIKRDNPMAMEIWNGICDYYQFLTDHQDLYSDLFTVSKIGVLAPPLIPSFEVSLKRESLYNALSEMSVMYEVILLHRLNAVDPLLKYEAIIIPNIPWITGEQLSVLKEYKNTGGKIYVIGSTNELRELADIYSATAIFSEFNGKPGRIELLKNLKEITGERMITFPGSRFVVANIAKKRDSEKYILHIVNYDKAVNNIEVKVNLTGMVNKIESVKLFSPDAVPLTINNQSFNNNILSFTLPRLEVYSVVTLN